MQEKVQIPGASDDERARRTRERLSWALIDLMREREFGDISVQDITARAEVGRSTFYLHFQDKADLFIQHSIAFSRMCGEHLHWEERTRAWRFPLAHLLEHVREFRFLYDALVRSRQLDRILKMGQIAMAEAFQRRIAEVQSSLPADLLASHYAATIMNMLQWWMDHHYPCGAREMEDHFHRLVARDVTPPQEEGVGAPSSREKNLSTIS